MAVATDHRHLCAAQVSKCTPQPPRLSLDPPRQKRAISFSRNSHRPIIDRSFALRGRSVPSRSRRGNPTIFHPVKAIVRATKLSFNYFCSVFDVRPGLPSSARERSPPRSAFAWRSISRRYLEPPASAERREIRMGRKFRCQNSIGLFRDCKWLSLLSRRAAGIIRGTINRPRTNPLTRESSAP